MTDPTPSRDLARTTFAVLFVCSMILMCFWILRPFLGSLIWATLLVVATWPALCRLQARLGNRRWLATTTMMLLVLLVFMVPFALMLSALIANAPEAATWVNELMENGLPAPPAWVSTIPLVGDSFADTWTGLSESGPEGVAAGIRPHLTELAGWFVAKAGGIGLLLFDFALTLLFAGLLFAKGERFALGIRRFARRLAGDRGDHATILAAKSIRAVALGVVITALIQSVVGGIGLAIAGIPAAGLLTAIMFVTSIAQIGAAPVIGLAAVWLFYEDSTGWGVAMIVWAVVVGSLDNIIRPMLIKKGVDLPLVLIFAGVIGGLIAFGLVGLFVGPVVLAVAHTLMSSWVAEDGPAEEVALGDAT